MSDLDFDIFVNTLMSCTRSWLRHHKSPFGWLLHRRAHNGTNTVSDSSSIWVPQIEVNLERLTSYSVCIYHSCQPAHLHKTFELLSRSRCCYQLNHGLSFVVEQFRIDLLEKTRIEMCSIYLDCSTIFQNRPISTTNKAIEFAASHIRDSHCCAETFADQAKCHMLDDPKGSF
jgi:hypothetical protein